MSINIFLNTLIHILILVLLFSFFLNNRDNTNSVIFILAAITVFICYMIEFVRRPKYIENFSAPLEYSMGPYNNIDLNKNNNWVDYTWDKEAKKTKMDRTKCGGWRMPPCNVPLHSQVGFVTPTGLEKKFIEDPSHSATLPSVTGNKEDPNRMFMFTHNQCHPDCCPSTYTCDRGCVCTTEAQRDFIAKRGLSRTSDIYPGI